MFNPIRPLACLFGRLRQLPAMPVDIDHLALADPTSQPWPDLTRIRDWDIRYPVEPQIVIPDLAGLIADLNANIAAHAAVGSLTDAYGDQFDYTIHTQADQWRTEATRRWHRGRPALQVIYDQGHQYLHALNTQLADHRWRSATATAEWHNAYIQLTGHTPPTRNPTTQPISIPLSSSNTPTTTAAPGDTTISTTAPGTARPNLHII